MNVRGEFDEAVQSNSRNTYNKLLRPDFRVQCDRLLDELVAGTFMANPSLKRLADPASFSKEFFVRSTTENVLRINLMRRINPIVCTIAAKLDPVLCKQWGLYAADEGLHDRMFARDLLSAGLKEDQIYETPLMFATELLAGYLYYTLENEGPLATVASAYYVESISAKTQPQWIKHMEERLGDGALRGSQAHLDQDREEGHIDLAWNMCMRLVKTPADEARFISHVRKLHALLSAYLTELHLSVFEKQDDLPAVPISAVQIAATA